MGNICSSNKQGIPMNSVEPISITKDGNTQDHSKNELLLENDVKIIKCRILVRDYNEKLYEKRNLQSRRAKSLEKGLTNEYYELIKATSDIDAEIMKVAEKETLLEYKIDPELFAKTKKFMNMQEISEIAIKNLMDLIRNNIAKIGLRGPNLEKLKSEYQAKYSECNFKLSEKPELTQKIAQCFHEDIYLNYTEIMTADMLYPEFELLPIEVASFIDSL